MLRAAARLGVVEMMEQRVMLSVDPDSALELKVHDIAVNPTQISQFAQVVDTLYDNAFANLPIAGGTVRKQGDNTAKLQTVSGTLAGVFSNLPKNGDITGTDLADALFAAFQGHLPSTPNANSLIDRITEDDSTGNIAEIRLKLPLDHVLFHDPLPWTSNLGLPRLGLQLNGELSAPTADSSTLVVGLNSTDGFFLDISGSSDVSFTLPQDVFVASPSSDDTAVARGGKLYWMPLKGTTSGTASFDSAVTFVQDFSLGQDNNLNYNDLTIGGKPNSSFTMRQSASNAAKGTANFKLEVGMDNPPVGVDLFMPALFADLHAEWDSAQVGGAWYYDAADAPTAKPKVSYQNVELGLGRLFDEYIGPVLHKVQEVLGPIKPALDALFTPIPLLTTLDNMMHFGWDQDGNGVNLKEVLVSQIKDEETKANTNKVIDAIYQVYQLIDKIPPVGASGLLSLGGCQFTNEDVRGLTGTVQLDLNSDKTVAGALDGKIVSNDPELKQQPLSVTSFLDAFNDTKLNPDAAPRLLSFAFLDNPSSIMSLFANETVDLIKLNLPPLGLDIPIEIGPIGPFFGVLNFSLLFDVKLEADLGFGYDTVGLANFARRNFADAGTLWDGFYISDWNGVVDVPELTLTITGGLQASVGWQYLNASITPYFQANISLDLHEPNENGANDGYVDDQGKPIEPDGKIRIKEITHMYAKGGILGLFHIYGSFTAGLDVGLTVLWMSWKWNVGTIELARFGDNPSVGTTSAALVEPKLATEDANGVLHLHVGSLASERGDLYASEINEAFTVSPGDGHQVKVAAFGYSQQFDGVTGISASAGDGNDVITIAPELNLPATLDGGDGDDQLAVGLASSTVYGGNGSDTITGGLGADCLFGGAGDDAISGGSGDDSIAGDSGSDTLSGDDGNDMIDGGAGDDYILGGGDDDSLYGRDGDDVLIGDVSRETHDGIPPLPFRPGEIGNDSLIGGPGHDRLLGDDFLLVKTTDPITGEVKPDIQYGAGGGNDTIVASPADDVIVGQGGDDLLILSGTGSFDLRSEANKAEADKLITGINRIDLNITGQEHLIVDVNSVRSITDGDNVLLIKGGPGDGVDLSEYWSVMPIQTITEAGIPQTYRVFESDAETVKIGPGVDVALRHMLSKSAGVTAEPISFTAPFDGTDPSTAQILWNFGDGTTLQPVPASQPGALNPAHAYDYTNKQLGTSAYTVTVVILGEDGGNTTFTDNQLVIYDMLYTAEGLLYVGGTPGNDFINISNHAGNKINVFRWGILVDIFPADINRPAIVYGGKGDDLLDAAPDLIVPMESHGGAGNDLLRGGKANDMLFGDEGDDRLDSRDGNDILIGGSGNDDFRAGDGRDLLIGGPGSDSLFGQQEEDLLVAGSTSYDTDVAALTQIGKLWANTLLPFAGRFDAIRSSFFDDAHVFDDARMDVDWLTGGVGYPEFPYVLDGFYGALGDDKLTDRISPTEKFVRLLPGTMPLSPVTSLPAPPALPSFPVSATEVLAPVSKAKATPAKSIKSLFAPAPLKKPINRRATISAIRNSVRSPFATERIGLSRA